jgi:hypothetical protein
MKRVDVITLREVENGENIGTIITNDLTKREVEDLMLNGLGEHFDCAKDDILFVEDLKWEEITDKYQPSFEFVIEIDGTYSGVIRVEKSWLY